MIFVVLCVFLIDIKREYTACEKIANYTRYAGSKTGDR